MGINNVSMNTAQASIQAPTAPQNSSGQNPKPKRKMPSFTTIGLTCLAVYAAASIVTGGVTKHQNMKFCQNIGEETPKIFAEIKEKASALIEQFKKSGIKIDKDGFWTVNQEGQTKFFDKLEDITADDITDVIYKRQGENISIITGLEEVRSKKLNIIPHLKKAENKEPKISHRTYKNLVEFNCNDFKPSKYMEEGLFAPATSKKDSTTTAQQIFNFGKEGNINSFGIRHTQIGQEENFRTFVKCNNEAPIRIEFDADHVQDKNLIGQLYELNGEGKWKKG